MKPQERCDRWNAQHPVGADVIVRRDNGDKHKGTTTSAAYVLSGHTAVIFVSGISGCYALDRVTPT